MRQGWHPRVAARAALILLHLLRGFWIIRMHFPRLQPQEQQRHVQRWAAQMLRAIGIELV